MKIEAIIDKLTNTTEGILPRDALKYAFSKKNEITPHLIKCIEDFPQNCKTMYPDNDLPFYSILLLSYFKCEEAHTAICDMLKITHDEEDDPLDIFLGQLLSEIIPTTLANTYNGDIKHIKSVIECSDANIFARDAAMRSLIILTIREKISKGETIKYFKSLLKTELESYDISMLNALIVDESYLLQSEELLPLIKAKFDKKVVDTHITRYRTTLPPDEFVKKYLRIDQSDNPIKILEKWQAVKESKNTISK